MIFYGFSGHSIIVLINIEHSKMQPNMKNKIEFNPSNVTQLKIGKRYQTKDLIILE